MSGKQKQDPISPDAEMEILELNQAQELVQAMEARGDFKFKGIFTLFTAVLSWTEKFPNNGVLPAMDQLEREVQVSREKLQEYLVELLGRGSSKTKMIYSIPAVELVGGAVQQLTQIQVFCRPIKTDGATVKRYIVSYVNKNCEVLAKWMDTRAPAAPGEYSEHLNQQIEKSRLHETQGGAEVARFFANNFDQTPEQKKVTYALITRPVIQKLIADHQLLHIRPSANALLPNYRGIYYNNVEELELRYSILSSVFVRKIIKDSSIELGEKVDIPTISKRASSINRDTFNGLPVGFKQVIAELLLLSGVLSKMRKDNQENEEKAELDDILLELAKAGRVVEMGRIKKMTDDLRLRIYGTASILNTDFPEGGRVLNFVLHKDSIVSAVKIARDIYDKTGNDSDIQILSEMGIENFMDADQLKAFQDLQQRTFFEQLPWYTRVWRSMFGNTKLKPEEAAKIKSELAKKNADAKLRMKTTQARKEQRKLVSQRMKKTEDKPAQSFEKSKAEKEHDNIEEAQHAVARDEQVDETLRKICEVLDAAWDRQELPGRTFLLENLPGFDESQLVNFLKKHARKEIFSFRVKNEKPEYVWPILISKRYIQRYGKTLLNKAMKEADTQRKAPMPNQEKFDVWTAIEDFLTRVLNKSR